MTENDKKTLQEQDSDTLAEWWCTLNRWSWPEGLPGPMTEEERNTKDFNPDNRASNIMAWIDGRIGHKKISRCWNKDSMDDEQFELFWRGTYERDEEAKKKYEAWAWERAKAQTEARA